MGNENSKDIEPTENGNISGKHSNGSVNGLSANITSNGLKIAVNTETLVQQNGEPFSLELATESTKPEIPETIIHKKEVKKGNEDQTDLSLPATNPQPESASSGAEAAAVTVTVHPEDFQYPQPKTEISTQTDGGSQADISTQTGEDDDDYTTTKATEEDPLKESPFVIAKVVYDESPDNHIAGNIGEEMVMENVYRAEWATITGNINLEENIVNGCEETELGIVAEPESNPKESIINEIAAEEDNIEETVPLEVFYSLPKVVAECVEVVFDAISESTDSPADRSADVIIIEDNGKGAGDMSALVVLIKTAEPESNAATPEASRANGVPSPGQEPATTAMETISEIVREEPNPTPVNQDMPVEELLVPLVPVCLVRVEPAHEKVSPDDAVAVETICDDNEQECDRCPEEEMIIVEAPPDDFFIIEDLPEETESMPDVMTTDEDTEVGVDAITYVGLDIFEEAELSPLFFKDDAELTLEAAIDALSLEFELTNTTPEPAVGNGIPLEEEVITASTFVPLTGELITEIIVEEAANVPPTDATEESEPCVSVQEELVEENVATAEGPTDSTHSISVEPELKNNILVVLLETTEDEVADEIPLETLHSGGALAAIESCKDATSDKPVSECVKAVLETIVEEIITEDIVAAECNCVASGEVAPHVIPHGEAEEKAEDESSVNSTDST